MTPEQVIEFFGSQTEAARALEVKQPAVSQWLSTGRISYLRQLHIQEVSGGALVASKIHEPSYPD